ncbi:zinc finger protein OZF-like isoform X2 [Cyprinodon tularosa]|uniref:zinc finger protein OZF-like isoform X2 n=1 Tax=Cyprinodon tularosa TaxID=77115 RepID=UPI0018E208CB|nr:zinc finger protein OZF-like isoform X2 [Cyprinodon tularosa]
MEEPAQSQQMGSSFQDVKNRCPKWDQEDLKPLVIKEEQDDSEIIEFIFSPVPVKMDDDEEKPRLSELHKTQTEVNTDSAGEESDEHRASDSSETDVSDGNFEENTDPQSVVDFGQINTFPVDDARCETGNPQLRLIKMELPAEEQNLRPSLDQKDLKLPRIKEEEHNAEVTQFIFNPVSVKSEDDEEKPQLSKLHHKQPDKNRLSTGQEDILRSNNVDEAIDSSDTDVSDGNWEESSEVQSGLGSIETRTGDLRCMRGEVLHSCKECGKIFSHRRNLLRHNIIHTGTKPFNCSICSKAFIWKGGFVQHMRTHSEEKPFSCSTCGRSFKNKENLNRHMKVHTTERPFSCSDCGKQFKSQETVTSHMRSHTKEKPFSCSICGKKFKRKASVQQHTKSHTEEKPFSCSVCGKKFKRSDSVPRHMILHTEDKPFSCSVCGKKFVRKESLVNHMSHHTSEKPYSCSVCNKAFTSKVTLIKHTRFHREDRQFSCSVCKASFKERSSLAVHIKIHTGEKPFSCSTCGRSFGQSSTLKRHMRRHTEEKPFSCPYCNVKFKWKNACVKHIKKHGAE